MEEKNEFNEEFNQKVNEVISIQDTTAHTCNCCAKNSPSARGLKRHIKSKHSVTEEQDSCFAIAILDVKQVTEQSVQKLLQEDLYSLYRKELEQFQIIRDENKKRVLLCDHVTMSIKTYCNKIEGFCPTFYKRISELKFPFPEVCPRPRGLILVFQAADFIVIKLTNSNSDNQQSNDINSGLTEREISIICYISGYISGTLYRRVFFKAKNSEYSNSYLKMLSLCRLVDEGGKLEPSI